METHDVLVIGAGPAGCQAAVSAAHHMRHVLVLDAGKVSRRKGRVYWSKTVALEDVPGFDPITGPNLIKRLHGWMEGHPVKSITIAGQQRQTGIIHQGGVVMSLSRNDDGTFLAECSTAPLKDGEVQQVEQFSAKTVVVAAGFEDVWPDIEMDADAEQTFKRHKAVLRYAGNQRGWHVCIRCDGHLHVNEHLALLGVGDDIYGAAIGAQDFTDKITILTNGRPHGFSERRVARLADKGIQVIDTPISKHIGKGTQLMGVELEDGTELMFDGFLVDEGLVPNTPFLKEWDYQTDAEGLVVVDDDNQLLDAAGEKVLGLYAAGDIVSGGRNLVATAFAMGQNAGISASDSLRRRG
jgi:thioredoxin reductase